MRIVKLGLTNNLLRVDFVSQHKNHEKFTLSYCGHFQHHIQFLTFGLHQNFSFSSQLQITKINRHQVCMPIRGDMLRGQSEGPSPLLEIFTQTHCNMSCVFSSIIWIHTTFDNRLFFFFFRFSSLFFFFPVLFCFFGLQYNKGGEGNVPSVQQGFWLPAI